MLFDGNNCSPSSSYIMQPACIHEQTNKTHIDFLSYMRMNERSDMNDGVLCLFVLFCFIFQPRAGMERISGKAGTTHTHTHTHTLTYTHNTHRHIHYRQTHSHTHKLVCYDNQLQTPTSVRQRPSDTVTRNSLQLKTLSYRSGLFSL